MTVPTQIYSFNSYGGYESERSLTGKSQGVGRAGSFSRLWSGLFWLLKAALFLGSWLPITWLFLLLLCHHTVLSLLRSFFLPIQEWCNLENSKNVLLVTESKNIDSHSWLLSCFCTPSVIYQQILSALFSTQTSSSPTSPQLRCSTEYCDNFPTVLCFKPYHPSACFLCRVILLKKPKPDDPVPHLPTSTWLPSHSESKAKPLYSSRMP